MYKLPKKKSSSEGNNRGRSIWGHPIIHYNSFFLAWLVIQGVPLWDVPIRLKADMKPLGGNGYAPGQTPYPQTIERASY